MRALGKEEGSERTSRVIELLTHLKNCGREEERQKREEEKNNIAKDARMRRRL